MKRVYVVLKHMPGEGFSLPHQAFESESDAKEFAYQMNADPNRDRPTAARYSVWTLVVQSEN